VNKTFEQMSRSYTWRNMRADIQQYINKCEICQRVKRPTQAVMGLLHPLPIPEHSWEQVTINFITHLPVSSRGYDCILVFVDKLTK
jgi:hypothetical protein